MPRNPKTSTETAQGVDLREVERLLHFMHSHGLEEFEYERNGFRVRLRKPSAGAAVAPRMTGVQEAAAAALAPVHEPGASPPLRSPGEPERSEDLHVIKSPIVGTFYASPNPGSAAFVSVGSRVETGQVLCIIEAMKLMNEIESDTAGEVARVYVENGHPVEYGQPLFGIRPGRGK
jgi:acetyl-CoA carboxylase biotin carboxyl carrier protein